MALRWIDANAGVQPLQPPAAREPGSRQTADERGCPGKRKTPTERIRQRQTMARRPGRGRRGLR